jgi:uncharacterized membrane protein YfcA
VSEAISLLLVFLIGIAASVVGTMVGGGSLLSIPFLIFIGLPPQVAIATDRFTGLGAACTALYKFWRAERIVWKFVPLLAVASLVGSVTGASILVTVDPGLLEPVVGVLLLVLLPILFLNRDVGVEARETSRPRMALGLSIYLLVQVLAGFFGGGTGTLIFYTLMMFFGITIIQVAATQILPFMVLTLSSLIVFAQSGIIDYGIGIVLMAGTAVGGYLGAHIAIESGERWVRRLFAAVVIGAGAKLLLW